MDEMTTTFDKNKVIPQGQLTTQLATVPCRLLLWPGPKALSISGSFSHLSPDDWAERVRNCKLYWLYSSQYAGYSEIKLVNDNNYLSFVCERCLT